MSRKRRRNKNTVSLEGLTGEEREAALKRRKFIRKQRRLKIWTTLLIFVLAGYMVIGVVGLSLVKIWTEDMPTLDVNDFIGEESSCIYDGDGNLIIELGTYYRQNITYDEISESLIDAFLSIEDSRFFEHNGFDLPRFTAAAISNLQGGDITSGQGGSTFTMQLVKNSYFSVDAGDDSTSYSAGTGVEYKVQQILLSIQLEQKLDKQEIFELYVNRLNFGQNIRGVEMASRYYFGKSASELNLSESALLAGIVNLPNTYNPYYYLDYATERRNEVLYMMLYHGYITEDEYNLAVSINVEDQLVGEYVDIQLESNSEYLEYIDVVIDEAIEMTGYDPVSVGMDIYTALDTDIQTLITNIENGNTTVTYGDDLMQSAIVTIDHSNGEIVALGGGRNYGSEGGSRLLNRAVDMYQQPGSTVKPVLAYALGFEYLGFSLDELVVDMEYSYPGETRIISDYDGEYLGVISIKAALADSRNIPAIMTLELVTEKVGSETVVDYIQSLGFDTITDDNYHLSAAIGSNDFYVTVAQLAGAHAAIMNLGVYNEPHTIRRIVTTDGDTYYPDNQEVQVLSSGSAYLVTQLMANNVTQNEYYNYATILERSWPIYAKTGTTDWDSSGEVYGIPDGSAKDEWMVASNSKYTNAVWTGYDEAVAGAGTYFTNAKLRMNIAGNINALLIDLEASLTDEAASTVEAPSDLVSVSYVEGTWPHVESGGAKGTTITSTVSATGLANTPMVSSITETYRVTPTGYVLGDNTVYSEGDTTEKSSSEETTTEETETTDTTTDNSSSSSNSNSNSSSSSGSGSSTDSSGSSSSGGSTSGGSSSGSGTSGGSSTDTSGGGSSSGSGDSSGGGSTDSSGGGSSSGGSTSGGSTGKEEESGGDSSGDTSGDSSEGS